VLGFTEADSGSYLEQELEKRVGLFVLQADDTACEAWVDVQGFFAGRLGSVSRMSDQEAIMMMPSKCEKEELTGCTRTIGWLFFTGSLRTNLPSRLAFSACLKPSCSASRPSSRRLIGSERRSYAATCETHAVSPPLAGTLSNVSRVNPGG